MENIVLIHTDVNQRHVHAYTRIRTSRHTPKHTHTSTHTHTHTHTHIHTRKHTHTHTHTHTYTHANTHANTHTYTKSTHIHTHSICLFSDKLADCIVNNYSVMKWMQKKISLIQKLNTTHKRGTITGIASDFGGFDRKINEKIRTPQVKNDPISVVTYQLTGTQCET